MAIRRRAQLTEAEADRAAEVFTTHHEFIESVSRRYAHDQNHVPDIVQSVGLQVCKGLTGFRDASEIATWLYRVTRNTAVSYWRTESRHIRAVEAVTGAADLARPGFAVGRQADSILDPDEQAETALRRAVVRTAMEQLKPTHREAIREEIDDPCVQLSERKSARYRARQALKAVLADNPRFTQ